MNVANINSEIRQKKKKTNKKTFHFDPVQERETN